jgi:aromatic-ring opening dioxygenase LigAB LigA subunit
VAAVSPPGEGAHYRFPPARAYRLNRCLYALKPDRDFLARFRADPAAATAGLGLNDEERADLGRMDRDALVARGAHPYLVFMAGLRLKIAADPGALEYF